MTEKPREATLCTDLWLLSRIIASLRLCSGRSPDQRRSHLHPGWYSPAGTVMPTKVHILNLSSCNCYTQVLVHDGSAWKCALFRKSVRVNRSYIWMWTWLLMVPRGWSSAVLVISNCSASVIFIVVREISCQLLDGLPFLLLLTFM